MNGDGPRAPCAECAGLHEQLVTEARALQAVGAALAIALAALALALYFRSR